jgi:hypothetical protein
LGIAEEVVRTLSRLDGGGAALRCVIPELEHTVRLLTREIADGDGLAGPKAA